MGRFRSSHGQSITGSAATASIVEKRSDFITVVVVVAIVILLGTVHNIRFQGARGTLGGNRSREHIVSNSN